MEIKQITLAALCVFSASSYAEDVPITGTVQSRCIINTEVAGIYGNPNAYTLTTTPADGGVLPVVRYDVSLADAYTAKITTLLASLLVHLSTTQWHGMDQ